MSQMTIFSENKNCNVSVFKRTSNMQNKIIPIWLKASEYETKKNKKEKVSVTIRKKHMEVIQNVRIFLADSYIL